METVADPGLANGVERRLKIPSPEKKFDFESQIVES